MPASAMNTNELLDATAAWAPGATSPTRAFLESAPASAMFLPVIDRCRAVLSSLPADGGELARATQDLVHLDDDHDAQGRFLVLLLEAGAHHPDEEIARRAQALLDLFFPGRLAFITFSYSAEAGLVPARADLLTPERRAWLASFPAPGAAGRTAEHEMDSLQAKASALGTRLQQRDTLVSAGMPTGQEILDTKRLLIRTITQVFTSWSSLEHEDLLTPTQVTYAKSLRENWNQKAKVATANATARRAAAAPAPAPAPAPTGTPPAPAPSGTGTGHS